LPFLPCVHLVYPFSAAARMAAQYGHCQKKPT
jgi:hypothetical protein